MKDNIWKTRLVKLQPPKKNALRLLVDYILNKTRIFSICANENLYTSAKSCQRPFCSY